MYNKTLTNVNSNLQEIVVTLGDSCLEKVLSYRDEGNMNIVVSLNTQGNDEKYVIRFKKISSDVDEKQQNFNDHKHELMSFIHFEELLQKYFDHFTVVPKIAFVDVDISALNEFLMRDRPVVRRTKVIGHNYGLLYRDVAFLPKEIYIGKQINGEFKDSPTICIEIKVKQGYVMTNDDQCAQKCRYCYFQYLKLKNAKITQISSYCPIDLFSGNAERMNRAIKGLFDNPQNNLKMFQDGKMVYNEYSPDKHSLKRIMKSLFPDVKSVDKQEILMINLIRKILTKDFTCCDNEIEICTGYESTENVHLRRCIGEMFSELPSNCILSSILKAQHLVGDNLTNMEFFEKEGMNAIDGYEKIVQDYRLGSTALDCSVMITLRKVNCNESFDNEIEKLVNKNHYLRLNVPGRSVQHFAVNVTVVDLDEKKDALAHYRKYKKQYMESKFAYYEFMKSIQ
ncbi:hypothetical protein PVAND_012178 [Polypedilum vanderplanki]|uniref:Inositol-pentakisphosphate 2-kinase n=1 Tax=Polypedilum vanderplanki TaxID=319348 RepID=A0A9J6CKU0_POLVA|nr:hypothetical protein PVAND_012178 [Polypedilum vanderplanki]